MENEEVLKIKWRMEIEEWRMKKSKKNRNTDNWKKEFSERLLTFAAEVIKLTGKLNSSYSSQHIIKQMIRSATSMGANYEEACNAESRNDFGDCLRSDLRLV
jgi:hypothetical protein